MAGRHRGNGACTDRHLDSVTDLAFVALIRPAVAKRSSGPLGGGA